MKFSVLLIHCTIDAFLVTSINGKLLDTSGELLLRKRRSLIWFEGVNWIQMVAGVGFPLELRDQSITVGTAVKAFYLLPTNSSDILQPSIDYARKKRSSSRWVTYKLIEDFFRRSGYGDGKACLLRSICDAAAKPFEKKSGILAEIVHAVLTPSSTREPLDDHFNCEYHAAEKLGKEINDCANLFPECPINFLDKFAKTTT